MAKEPPAQAAHPWPEVTLGPGAEFDRVRILRAAAGAVGQAGAGIRLGAGDDAAALVAGDLVVSTDLSVEDVHFRLKWMTPAEIGFRATTAALSDLAAMAASPVAVLVSAALPSNLAQPDLEGLGLGIADACRDVDAAWVGGDLSSTPGGLVLDVTVLGICSQPVTRAGADRGHEVWVTGRLGGSAAAVRAWTSGQEPDPRLRTRFVRPTARTREALWLREEGLARAMIDLSDGLVADARHLAAASGRKIVLDVEAVPVDSVAAERLGRSEAVRAALTGGEDYELCLTVEAGALGPRVDEFRERFGVDLTRVGTVERGSGVYLRRHPAAAPTEAGTDGGYDHFTEDREAP